MKHFYTSIFLLTLPLLIISMESSTSKKLRLLSCFGKKSKKEVKNPPAPPSNSSIESETPQKRDEIHIIPPVSSSSPRLTGPYMKKDCSKTTISSARKISRSSYKPADFKIDPAISDKKEA